MTTSNSVAEVPSPVWSTMVHDVHSLVMTHSGYSGADGNPVRDRAKALQEGRAAARTLGYQLTAHEEDTLDIPFSDENVCRVLDALGRTQADTVFTHWVGDTHPAHRRVGEMTIQACRRVPRLFGFSVNWYLGPDPFHATTYVPISEEQWARRNQALACYAEEMSRAGNAWLEYSDRQTRNDGVRISVSRAEGFVTIKNLWETPLA